MFFHRHTYKAISATYTPAPKTVRADRISIEAMKELIYGVSVVLYRCTTCRSEKVESVTGRFDIPQDPN